MRTTRNTVGFVAIVLVTLALGCNKQAANEQPTSNTKSSPSSKDAAAGHAPTPDMGTKSTPAAHADPHSGAMANPHEAPHAAAVAGNELKLNGLVMTIPDGWNRGEIAPGPFAPVAVFLIPKAGDDAEDGQVRITHFPAMKGKDDMNIQRWLGQVTKDDGSSYSPEEANVTVKESGNVRIKTIDVSGNVKATMRETPHAHSRMIAAIVDHPQGPHFVVASGGVATLDKAAASIKAFLESAKVE